MSTYTPPEAPIQIICPMYDRDKMCTVTTEFYEAQKLFAEEDPAYPGLYDGFLYEIPEEVAIQWLFNVKKVDVEYLLVDTLYTETYECLATPLGVEPKEYSPAGKPPPNLRLNDYGNGELNAEGIYQYWSTATTIPDTGPEYDHLAWNPPTDNQERIFLYQGKWYHSGVSKYNNDPPPPYLTMTQHLWAVTLKAGDSGYEIFPLHATILETFF